MDPKNEKETPELFYYNERTGGLSVKLLEGAGKDGDVITVYKKAYVRTLRVQTNLSKGAPVVAKNKVPA